MNPQEALRAVERIEADTTQKRIEEAQAWLLRRRGAYEKCFKDNAYADDVLLDLKDFCGADKDLFDRDQRTHAYFEGRRSVWLHILKVLEQTPEQIRGLAQSEGGTP